MDKISEAIWANGFFTPEAGWFMIWMSCTLLAAIALRGLGILILWLINKSHQRISGRADSVSSVWPYGTP